MKIFITGIAGFLGSHLSDYFIENSHEVVGCDNLFGGDLKNVNKNVEFYKHDICGDLASLTSIMKNCDVVYHCAAAAYEGISVFTPAFISNNIYHGSASVFSAAIQNKVKRIVNCSSMARYGTNEVPFRETFDLKPQDPYGIAKEAAERLLINLSNVHNFEYVIAVPHNIYGPRQKHDDPYRNVVSIMANLMLRGRQPIIYGDGTQKRCFSYIDDVVGCLGMMATEDNVVSQTINIGPDEEFITINDLALRLSKIIGLNNLEPQYVPSRPQEVNLATCSADKARKLLGYSTKTSLDQGLKNLVESIKEAGTKPFKYHFEPEIKNEKTPKTWTEKLF